MKYLFRISVALMTFLLSTGAVLLWPQLWKHPTGTPTTIPAPTDDTAGKVTFRFQECAGTIAVFSLKNRTDHPIFARLVSGETWEKFEVAHLRYGVHHIKYKASGATDFKNASDAFDAIPGFRAIMPNETVRYGVFLWNGPGEYEVSVPYMENAEVARRMDEDFSSLIKNEPDLVDSPWKVVSSGIVTRTCK